MIQRESAYKIHTAFNCEEVGIIQKNYLKLQRKEDQAVIAKIDGMVRELNRRCNTTFG